MDLTGRILPLFQPTLNGWIMQFSMFFALWSPFFAHLYDSPPSHNFFATGFRPKKSAY